MEINVLGPFSAREGGVSIVPTATKLRQLLALLALQGDHIVTTDELMEELWGESPPKSASSILQTYVVQLRRKLAEGLGLHGDVEAKNVLVTRQGGYLLRIGDGWVDSHEFDQRAEAGRSASERGDHRLASGCFADALDMWKGPALVDVRVGNVLQFEALRMRESRTAVLQQRIEADMQVGRYAALVPELQVLVARNPLSENFCAQLMVAFQRMGCAWRALQVYQRLRDVLARDLGLEPSAMLQEIHRAVLLGEPARNPFAPHGSGVAGHRGRITGSAFPALADRPFSTVAR